MVDLEIRHAITQVQQGQNEIRESLLQQYLPFILKVTSRSCKRFVRMGEDDEVSVALLAFNEAMDKYDCGHKTSFFAFAESVIRRRMIDYFRKSGQNRKEIPWTALSEEGEDEVTYKLDRLTWETARSHYFEDEIKVLRRDEIMEYQNKLLQYGITLRDLVEVSPKHQDARASAFAVARIISENAAYRQYLERTKSLPLKELETKTQVSRKTLERQRKYIIALTLVLTGQFYFLEDYLEGMKEG